MAALLGLAIWGWCCQDCRYGQCRTRGHSMTLKTVTSSSLLDHWVSSHRRGGLSRGHPEMGMEMGQETQAEPSLRDTLAIRVDAGPLEGGHGW